MKNKLTKWDILGIASVIPVVITCILGSTQHAMVQNTSFEPAILIAATAGIILQFLSVMNSKDFIPLLASIAYSVTFGLIVKSGAEVVNDKMLNIQFSGGNFPQVLSYLIMMGIAVVVSVVICFVKQKGASRP